MRSPTISEAERIAITVACQRFIDEFLKPRFLPAVCTTKFNYPIDILGKWHGTRYRFIQRYRSGFPDNFGEEMKVGFYACDYCRCQEKMKGGAIVGEIDTSGARSHY